MTSQSWKGDFIQVGVRQVITQNLELLHGAQLTRDAVSSASNQESKGLVELVRVVGSYDQCADQFKCCHAF